MTANTNRTEAVEGGSSSHDLFEIGDKLAFDWGSNATLGNIVAITGENILVRHYCGMEIFTAAQLKARRAVIMPPRRSFWKRFLGISNS